MKPCVRRRFLLSGLVGFFLCWHETVGTARVFCDTSHGNQKSLTNEASVEKSSIAVANGQLTIIQRAKDSDASDNRLLIHFHGAVPTVQTALNRCRVPGTVAVVNFPGLSSAYSEPFAADPKLFETILKACLPGKDTATHEPDLTLSSFSAGYGAIREILKSREHFDRVDAIVTADSIYAGLDSESPVRMVSVTNMQDFLRFADAATQKRKVFILSHSAQRTPYASTTETAGYLLNSLGINRTQTHQIHQTGFLPSTTARQGYFEVMGFEGETGQHHMQHLHNLDVLWNKRFSLPSVPPISEP
ncbi:MAG: hypothetical protein KDA91_21180 [Planctomycetaceae bacterium]|nr:hypothetical protein [Planctomycetaceae bacterium]